MVAIGNIISRLSESYSAIKKHNDDMNREQENLDSIVYQRERRLRDIITTARGGLWSSIPYLIVFFPMKTFLLDTQIVERDINTAMAHIDARNYNTGHAMLKEVAEEEGIVESDSLFRKFAEGRLTSDALRKYMAYHYPEYAGKELAAFSFQTGYDSRFSTSLEKIVASDGKEFFAIGDDYGNFYAFNGVDSLRTGLSQKIRGKLIPVKKEGQEQVLLTVTEDGLVYEIKIEQRVVPPQHEETEAETPIKKWYTFVVSTLYDAKEKTSTLYAAEFPYKDSPKAYFFATATGKTVGIDENGTVIFQQDQDRDACGNGMIHTPAVLSNMYDEPRGIITSDCDNNLLVYNHSGFNRITLGLDDPIIDISINKSGLGVQDNVIITTGKQSYAVWITPKGRSPLKYKYMVFADEYTVNRYAYSVEPKEPLSIMVLENLTSGQSNKGIQRIVLEDINRDSFADVLYTNRGYCGVLFGNETKEFVKGWEYSHMEFSYNELFTTEPLLVDVDNDGSGELIVGTDILGLDRYRGRVYVFDALSGEIEHSFGTIDNVHGERIKYDALNGTTYLTYATKNSVVLLGSDWLKVEKGQ